MAEAAALAGVGWVVSPIVTRLLNEGFSYLGDKGCSCLAAGIKDRLDKLETTILPQFQLVIEAAEKTEHKTKMERWLRKLKDALYEAEDMLDLYKYKLLEEKVNDLNSDLAAKLYGKFVANFSSQKIKLRRSLNKLEMIAAEAKTFRELLQIPIGDHMTAHGSSNGGGRPNATTSLPPPKVFGRDKERDEIIDKYLLDPSESSEPGKSYSVVAIVGIGGAGKTTLAQVVYNDPRVVDHFDIKMWVCVSRKLDVSRHTREMIESASKNECPRMENLDALQGKLLDLIKSKKVLLVLDDVWYDKSMNEAKWENILAPLANHGKSGSKILVTTRTENLPVALRSQYKMALRDLEENYIVSLFMLHAFGGTKLNDTRLQEELENIGKHIVRKLHGSPLAVKALCGRLSKKLEANYWRTALEQDNLRDTQQTLLWSYQRLDAPLQRCFSSFSLFPRGFSCDAEEMALMWIAEGFINSPKDGRRMEDIGIDYFYELVSGSFLQHREGDRYYMHDLFHDLAENISIEDCLKIEDDQVREIPLTIRHLSIWNECLMENNIGLDKLENLRTLMINVPLSSRVADPLFAAIEKYKKLRFLLLPDVSRETLTKLIANLKHLRFLAFDCSEWVELPATLSRLYHLQVLIPPYDASLPRSLKNLINLRHLKGDEKALSELPYIGRLTSLQTLPQFVVKMEKGHDIGQLKNLNEVQGSLTISELENVESKDKAVEANLGDKKHLESLNLEWGYSDEIGYRRDLDKEVLEGLQPHPNLTELGIFGYNSPRYPSWFLQEGCLPNLRSLKFTHCPTLVLPHIGKLFPNCHKLTICSLSYLRKFPLLPKSLKELVISDCPSSILVSKEEVQKSDDRKKSVMTIVRSSHLKTELNITEEELRSDCWEIKKLLKYEKLDVPEDFMTLATALNSSDSSDSSDIMDNLDLWEAYCRCQELRLEVVFGRREKNELILPVTLEVLKITFCYITDGVLSQSLKRVTSLKSLELSDIKTITTLPSEEVLHHLIALTNLAIYSCPWLKLLGGSYALPSLERLYIYSCNCLELEMVMPLPGEGRGRGFLPPSLRSLHITSCRSIKSFIVANDLPNLDKICLQDCPSLASLSLSHLTALRKLEISECPKLSSLSSNLPDSLEELHLRRCLGLSSLPEHLPDSLHTLYLTDCPGIASLPVHLPKSLCKLDLRDCPVISSLPVHLPELLSSLSLRNCPRISSMPVHMPKSLSYLMLADCPGILSLPDLPESFKFISIIRCPVLEERCQSPNGEDWPKIAHIPWRNIG